MLLFSIHGPCCQLLNNPKGSPDGSIVTALNLYVSRTGLSLTQEGSYVSGDFSYKSDGVVHANDYDVPDIGRRSISRMVVMTSAFLRQGKKIMAARSQYGRISIPGRPVIASVLSRKYVLFWRVA